MCVCVCYITLLLLVVVLYVLLLKPELLCYLKKGLFRRLQLNPVSTKNLSGLHSALTSTIMNTFGINWNADCTPDVLA